MARYFDFNWFSCICTFSGKKEVTVPVSSPIQLECDDDLRVNNINVTVRRSKTSCLTTFKACSVPTEAIEFIKKSCNNQVSCEVDIRNITNNRSCLQEYGYFKFSYKCKSKCSNFDAFERKLNLSSTSTHKNL